MVSRFIKLKDKALEMRRRGESLGAIEATLGIPRSTLNGWFKHILLTKEQKNELDRRWRQALVTARKGAVKWHREQKAVRLAESKRQAQAVYETIDKNNLTSLEVALAFLYLGEGFKRDGNFGLGNSDSKILRFYVRALRKLYGVQPEAFRAELHLRADQDEKRLKIFWSKQLEIPLSCFRYVVKDKRTVGRPTYKGYNGVCSLTGGGVEIQRRLLYLAEMFCTRT